MRWSAFLTSWRAARCMSASRRRIKVPDDLAVVGFGDSDVSRVCQPPLTTMAVPHHKIGIEAGRALLERLNEGNWSGRKPIVSSLCLRDSC
ncbi:HTH-type transcriptional repressor CytR [Raoultella terrigena]|uniref:HTH-type transcriptional repressor CytR n=1 Tax=Raoultella terrigena TaxID=577 RepID=A0A4U9D0G8_RAOTE|nr:HTH-type transcriptional repressor CytR [Raoultella terrigena]